MLFCELCQIFKNTIFTEHLHNKIYQSSFYYNLKVLKYLPRFLTKMAHKKDLIKTVTFQGLLHLFLVNDIVSKSSVIFI